MRNFRVRVREVHIQPIAVEAESVDEAVRKVEAGGGETLLNSLEYSHTLPSDTWQAEEDSAPRCARCSSSLVKGRCLDVTCPFSSHEQVCPVGWAGHPEKDPRPRQDERGVCTCRTAVPPDAQATDREGA